MKTFYIFIFLFFISCVSYTRKEGVHQYTPIVDKKFIPSHSEMGMHYGYSIMKGKTCWHYGEHTVSDEFFIYYMVYSDTIGWEVNKDRYDTTEIGDLLTKYYTYLYQDSVLVDSSLTIE
jgi:hypothetical protein